MFPTRRGSLKAVKSTAYLSSIVDSCLDRGLRKLLIVLDNVPVHSKAEEQLQQKRQTLDPTTYEAVKLLRLPPCGPTLNPHNFWSNSKAQVKDETKRRRAEIINSDIGREPGDSILNKPLRILEDIAGVTSAARIAIISQLSHYFHHMHFFHLPRAVQGNDLLC